MQEIIILLILLVIIGVLGQVFLKKGLSEIGKIKLADIRSFQTIFRIFSNKFVILGLSLSAVAAFFWIVALSQTNLSFLYPLTGGIFYIALFIVSWIFLKENITFYNLAGAGIIIIGIFLLTRR